MSNPRPEIVLKPGRDRAVRRRHPWVLSGAVRDVRGAPEAGDEVRVLSAEGECLGIGHYSPASPLRVRLLTFGKEASGGDALLEERVTSAVAQRADDPALGDTDAVRLINAEGDGLPGLVVDRYADVVVVKCTTPGMARRVDVIAAALERATRAPVGWARADTGASRREGFTSESRTLWGGALPERVAIREGERRYEVDPAAGQKTGFYLDQRLARDAVARLAHGRHVLDAFAYTGGFSVAAARAGAESVTLVDSSAPALAQAELHLEANAPAVRRRIEKADAFQFLRKDEAHYGLIVLDPPPLARNRHDVPKATRAMKDALLHGLRRAEPDAWVLAFSCSHHVGPDLFRKIVFGASLDAGRPLQVVGVLGPPSDHPVALDHPEGAYLTGLVLRA